MARSALTRLLDDIQRKHVDVVVVYKVDRLSRSLLDSAKLMETFDKHGVPSSRSRGSSTPRRRWGG
jgi:DNA invertase Pin-like site-specific DNA recombinase